MENLLIESSNSSPRVELNADKGVFIFEGRSLPEDPMEFYEPIIKWFESYSEQPVTGANFQFKLTYFNTASSKIFFNLFQAIDKINLNKSEASNSITIYTNEDDEDLMELFEYYKELLNSNCLELKTY